MPKGNPTVAPIARDLSKGGILKNPINKIHAVTGTEIPNRKPIIRLIFIMAQFFGSSRKSFILSI